MANEIFVLWLNSYIMSIFSALLLFGLGSGLVYAILRLKDHENPD